MIPRRDLRVVDFYTYSDLLLLLLTPRRTSCLSKSNVAELDLPFGVVARFLSPLPLHLSPYAQEY